MCWGRSLVTGTALPTDADKRVTQIGQHKCGAADRAEQKCARQRSQRDGGRDSWRPADFGEMHVLDDKTARKVPKKMQGRLLSQQEAKALLERICM